MADQLNFRGKCQKRQKDELSTLIMLYDFKKSRGGYRYVAPPFKIHHWFKHSRINAEIKTTMIKGKLERNKRLVGIFRLAGERRHTFVFAWSPGGGGGASIAVFFSVVRRRTLIAYCRF